MRIPTPLAVLVGALLGAVALPMALQRERPAKAAFEYVPPPGFTPATGEVRRRLTQGAAAKNEDEDNPDRLAWVAPPKSPSEPAPRIVLVHDSARQPIDEPTLGKIAASMTEHQRSQGLVWTLTRTRVIERADGGRVGLVAWEVQTAPESSQPKTAPRRAIQLSFPDDTGMSVVTAQFLLGDDETLSPLVEATAEQAHGVTVRPAPLALWIRLLAAIGLGALGYLLARLTQRAAASRAT